MRLPRLHKRHSAVRLQAAAIVLARPRISTLRKPGFCKRDTRRPMPTARPCPRLRRRRWPLALAAGAPGSDEFALHLYVCSDANIGRFPAKSLKIATWRTKSQD
jgi:hypothetical protein